MDIPIEIAIETTFEKSSKTLTSAQILKTKSVCEIMQKLKEDGRVDNIGLTALGDTKPISCLLYTSPSPRD